MSSDRYLCIEVLSNRYDLDDIIPLDVVCTDALFQNRQQYPVGNYIPMMIVAPTDESTITKIENDKFIITHAKIVEILNPVDYIDINMDVEPDDIEYAEHIKTFLSMSYVDEKTMIAEIHKCMNNYIFIRDKTLAMTNALVDSLESNKKLCRVVHHIPVEHFDSSMIWRLLKIDPLYLMMIPKSCITDEMKSHYDEQTKDLNELLNGLSNNSVHEQSF